MTANLVNPSVFEIFTLKGNLCQQNFTLLIYKIVNSISKWLLSFTWITLEKLLMQTVFWIKNIIPLVLQIQSHIYYRLALYLTEGSKSVVKTDISKHPLFYTYHSWAWNENTQYFTVLIQFLLKSSPTISKEISMQLYKMLNPKFQ